VTGTVIRVSTKSGLIKTDSGRVLYFKKSAVLEPGFDSLDKGHPVTFDVDSENRRIAVEVLRHFEWGPDNPPLEGGGKPPHLRYMGYEQEGSIRSYRFVAVSEQGRTVIFRIDASMELLAERRVRIQDAPELCLHALESELTPADWSAPEPLLHKLKAEHFEKVPD
jgi:cold shock CspA family protein